MFLCAYRVNGGPVDRAELWWPRGGAVEVQRAIVVDGSFAAAVRQGPRLLRPLLARYRHLLGVGDVRLDDRGAAARLAGLDGPGDRSDLELALAAIDARGERAIGELIGDFGFVVWDPRAHKVIASRDAFGVRTLYHRTVGDVLYFADRIETLRPAGDWDSEYFADYLMGMVAPGQRTPWRDVQGVSPGGFLLTRGSVRSERRYWSADAFEPVERDAEAVDRFRGLLDEAVTTRMGAPGQTWAQLSGGLDSSSIVAIGYGTGEGLAGTITSVDTLGRGDERRFSDAVLKRYKVRNEQVVDQWAWQDDGCPPPVTDGPGVLYPFFARERRMHEVLRLSGARVLLSGMGSDHYLSGSLDYLADRAVAGDWRGTLSDLALWSVERRRSFWGLARAHLLAPLLPGFGRRAEHVPAWITSGFARDHALDALLPHRRLAASPPGRKFAAPIAAGLRAIEAGLHRWPYGEEIEVRYPFLHRPLVEASLRLAPDLRIRPGGGTKFVLREAMRGRLPEEVRTRTGKGTIDDRIMWSFGRERDRIDGLLGNSIMAQLGWIDPRTLRDELHRARCGVRTHMVHLMSALSLETWLAVRDGRWVQERHAAASAA